MIRLWAYGLIRHRGGRLLAALVGVAMAVALLAALGSFLVASKATMTQRALRSVAVDWQVQVRPGGSVRGVLDLVERTPGTRAALPVGFARTDGFAATAHGTTQTTGPGMAVGLPAGYRARFPDAIRTLAGSPNGVLLAQQTASNLHAAPGDTIRLRLPGVGPRTVRVDGVVDLPQADSMFQVVGAPSQSQPPAPPDNVVLLPAHRFDALTRGATGVSTQIHADRGGARLPSDPGAAYVAATGTAHHLEARSAGAALVGDNLGAALDSARQDALYAQMLFLFLGVPGALLAAALTIAVASSDRVRRRQEQSLLRIRGLRPRQILALAVTESSVVGIAGGLLGLGVAALTGWLAFGSVSFGAGAAVPWYALAFLAGAGIATSAVVVPGVRDLRTVTVVNARTTAEGRDRSPWWMRCGLDVGLLIGSWLTFRASSSDQYALVLAPEGVPSISVSYWAFLGPAMLWVGGALLLLRLWRYALAYGTPAFRWLVRPLTGTLAGPTVATMTRRRGPLARSVVLVALSVSFAISTAVFDATYQQQVEVDARLTNGADVTVTEPPGARIPPGAAHRLRVPGARTVEPIQHRFAYVGSDLQDLYGVRPDTVTDATSLQDAYFSGGTARDLMRELARHPDNLLVSAETARDFQLSVGDTVNLRIVDARTKALRTVRFHYAGIVKEFPTAPKDSFFVANASYIARVTGNDAVGAFLISTANGAERQVAERLRDRLGTSATVTDLTRTRGLVGTSLTAVDLRGLTRIELAFAVLLAAGAGGLVLALGLAERRRTFAIATVLGARRRQLRGMVLTDALLLVVGGLAGGALLGWVLSRMLVVVLTGVFDPPPDTLSVPGGYLAVLGAVVAGAIVAAGLNGSRAARRPANEELRDL